MKKQLTKYHSNDNLPSKMKKKLVDDRDLVKTALIGLGLGKKCKKSYKLELATSKY